MEKKKKKSSIEEFQKSLLNAMDLDQPEDSEEEKKKKAKERALKQLGSK